MRSWLKKTSLIGLCFLAAASARAEESLGTLQVKRIYLRPEYRAIEKQDGEFLLERAALGLQWSMGEELSAQASLGPLSMRSRSYIYRDSNLDTDADNWGPVEAYGQYAFEEVGFRMGLVPLGYGFLGIMPEEHQDLDRPLFYRQGLITERDFGASIYSHRHGYFSILSVHNGESGPDTDGRLWLSGHWGYQREGFAIGLMGQAGATKAMGTVNSKLKVANFDAASAADWSMGGAFWQLRYSQFEVRNEWNWGRVKQAVGEHPGFDSGFLEMNFALSEIFRILGRYDVFDPNHKTHEGRTTEVSLGLTLHNPTETSGLCLQYVKIRDEPTDLKNDEVRLAWRFSPLSRRATDW